MYPLSVAGLSRISVICSIPICVALSFIGAYPRPISVVCLCIACVALGSLRLCLMRFLPLYRGVFLLSQVACP